MVTGTFRPPVPDLTPLFPMTEDTATTGVSARDLLRQVFKYWLTVCTCLAVTSLLTWGALLRQPAIYESSAKVWVQTEQQGTPSFLSGIAAYRESQAPEPVNRKIETEIQLLLSRSNAEAVIARLGITKNQLLRSPFDYLTDNLPSWLNWKSPETAVELHNEVVELFVKAIAVEPLRTRTADTTSNVLEARFYCADKALGPRALAALLQEYMQFGSQRNRELGESTRRLVDSKILEEAAELKALDERILALTIEQAARGNVFLPAAGATARRVVRTPNGMTLDGNALGSESNGSSSLGLLRSQAIEMQAKLEEAQQLYTEESPNVRRLQAQLQELRQRLSAAIRVSAELSTELEQLNRQRALALDRFTELRTKSDQIELYLQVNHVESDSRSIIETPLQADKPERKAKILVAILGPIGGLCLGLLLAGLSEYFDHRLQTSEDIKRFLGLDTLGMVPKTGT
jgi:uncharacterized protein involved in exopolysaccharide biosynthesis